MIAVLRRYLARKRLRPVVGALPRRLTKAFGAREHYTFLQASRVVSDMRLAQDACPYAFAAACTLEEFEKGTGLAVTQYKQLRTELAKLFDLVGPGFTMKHLLATRYSSHDPAPDKTDGFYAWGRGRHSESIRIRTSQTQRV